LNLDISVVIPVYNESRNVVQLANELRAALDNVVEYEVLVVDDASTDDTDAHLREAAEILQSRLRVIRHTENCGQSAAVVSGVRAAHGPWIATLDGDGQNAPADIPNLWAVIKAADCPPELGMVAGHRVDRKDTQLKRISSRIANGVRSKLLKDGTPDTGCGLKLFSRQVFLALPVFDHMHRFLPALFQREGWLVRSVPVSHRHRVHGKSKYGLHNRLWVGIIDLFGVAWLQRRAITPSAVEEKHGF